MRYDYEWPLDFPDPVLCEALEIALDYLQGTGQIEPFSGAEDRVAAAILAAWSLGTRHPIRLANAGIRAIERAPTSVPTEPMDPEVLSFCERFFDR